MSVLRCAIFGALVGCGGGGSETTPVADAGADVALDTALDGGAASGIPRCGPGPWLVHTERFFFGYGTKKPVPSLPVKVDSCPELDLKTDAEGVVRFAFTFGQRYNTLSGHPGFTPAWGSRYLAIIDFTGESFFLSPRPAPPPPKEGAGLILQYYTTGGRPPPCDNRDGVRAKVVEYPEARTRYWFDDKEVAETDLRNHITIEGLPVGVDVTVVAEKDGCNVDLVKRSYQQLKAHTHFGHLTQVDIEILDPIVSAPDAGGDGG